MNLLEGWARRNDIVLLDVSGKPSLRVFYLSEGSECLQAVVEEQQQGFRVDIWSIETINDEEVHHSYVIPTAEVTRKLDEIVAKMRSWFQDRRSLP